MNEIPERQNATQNLHCLAAQRYVYSAAKRLVAAQLILVFPVTIGVDALVRAVAGQHMWIAAAVAVFVAGINGMWLEPRAKYLARIASRLQEHFDVSVLALTENAILAGRPIAMEETAEYARRFFARGGSRDSLRNWYPTAVGALSVGPARTICQRENLWWDASLRKAFSRDFLVLATVTLSVLSVVSLLLDLDLRLFVLFVLVPVVPLFAFCTRYLLENRRLFAQLDDIRAFVEDLWHKTLQEPVPDEAASSDARRIQDMILLKRESGPLVFDWYYRLRRKHQQAQIQYSVDHMVREFQDRTRKSGA